MNIFHAGDDVMSTTDGDCEDSPPLFDNVPASSTLVNEHIPWEKVCDRLIITDPY